jgi:protein phosphatase
MSGVCRRRQAKSRFLWPRNGQERDTVRDISMIDTEEFPLPIIRQQSAQTLSSHVAVDLAGLSDQGKKRLNNEDTYFIARFDRRMQALSTSLPDGEYPLVSSETSYGMLVADGMGGHAAGEVASRTTVRVMLDLVLQTPDWIMRLDDQLIEEVFRRTERRVREIQGELAKQAQADATLAGMGTTLTLAWSLGDELLVAHVGDSRAYLMRDGYLQQLTRDQTLAQEMVEAGKLSPEEASRHRLRHVLTGVLTTGTKKVPVEFRRFRLVDGDQVLLCSDGLTEMVPETNMAEVLLQPGSAIDACRMLVDLALNAGGKDNVTVVLARYHFPRGDEGE